MERKNEVFNYTYSASQQAEIKSIREKYIPPTEEDDKMERLRRLDRSVTKTGTAVSIIVGIISTLVFGVGMCCTMVWEGLMLPGIMIGIVGIAGIVSAYPLYNYVTKKQREKVAPEIIKLSDELMK
ncbi:MAG: hypothetical protein K2K20_07285 [Lachnospiraceae bacterium]|nr:hypothetical protein [Lachnospiraceae bacterium]